MKQLTELETLILGIIEEKSTAKNPLVRHATIVKELAILERAEYLSNQDVSEMIQALAGLKEGRFIEEVEESYRLISLDDA